VLQVRSPALPCADTEEVTGSNPVSPTSRGPSQRPIPGRPLAAVPNAGQMPNRQDTAYGQHEVALEREQDQAFEVVDVPLAAGWED
jgi:hypothetical protein